MVYFVHESIEPNEETFMSDKKPHQLNSCLNTILLAAIGFGCFAVWGVGGVFIVFSTARSGFYMPLLAVLMLGIFLFAAGALFRSRIVRRIAYGIVILGVAAGASFKAWTWWTVDRFPVMEQGVAWWQYRPFVEGNKLVKVELSPQYTLNPDGQYPRLNGAYALYPIYAAMVQGMYPKHIAQDFHYITTGGSDVIYEDLLKGDCDLIFALAPSKLQAEDAEKAGIEYELTPFCMDAFVFFVNADNPVENLTTEQIRGIYSGRITDWKEVGAPSGTKIIPYQRWQGSASQEMFEKFMGDTPIMPPPKEDEVVGEGQIITATANYRNYKAALGFSFRHSAEEMLRNKQIKLLSIDGVAPTIENIRDGSYPLVATAYMVTARPRSANVQKIVDFMLSPEGQKLVEDTGYVPVGAASEP